MAKVDATAFKAAIALAAAQLTTALQDDTLTELAVDFKNPATPLRYVENLFLMNAATGVVTANDDYVDAAYAGNFPMGQNAMDKIGPKTPIAVTSATLETAAPNDIVITMTSQVSKAQAMSIAGAAAAGKTITKVSTLGLVVTVTTDIAFIAADVVTVSGEIFGVGYNNITLAAQAVTNNIA